MARLTCLKPRIQLAAAPKMAQPQAQERTRGTTWMNIRARILKRDCGLCQCQECKESGAIRLAHEVDHKVPLWEGGTDDDDNLQAINRDCHKRKSALEANRRFTNAEIDGAALFPSWLKPAGRRLTIVFGPPASGKSTHIKANAKPGDVVIDLDVIRSELSGLPIYAAGPETLAPAMERRNRMLEALAHDGPDAWFVVTGTGAERTWWTTALQPASVVVMDTPQDECIRRINADPLREAVRDRQVAAVKRWFDAEL